MNIPNYVNVLVLVAGLYFFFKDKIDPIIKAFFANQPNITDIGMPPGNDLTEPARHFKRCCNLDNEPINAAMSVAKALDGEDREQFINNTVPVLVKRSLENEQK